MIRGAFRLAVVAVLPLALAAGCNESTGSQGDPPSAAPTAASSVVPPSFAPACGKPGARVTVTAADLPVTISRAACDLRGVTVVTATGSDTVPGGQEGPTECTGGVGCPTISVNPTSHDVTVS